MTAYASDEASISNLSVQCEMRSINHRYSEISFRLPERCRFLETELRSVISKYIKRGKIDCTLAYKLQAKDSLNLTVNHEAVTALLVAIEQIELQMITPQSFSALDVLRFPGVQQELEIDREALASGFLSLAENTLKKLVEVREREGFNLKQIIEQRSGKMQNYANLASQRMIVVQLVTRNKLKDKITKLIDRPDFERLEQELVYLAQKLDISEELDRLDTHITEVNRVLNEDDVAGKRLDFLMQEMYRETNTMASKSMDKQISQFSIEIKVLIEQIREQVQNIE
jgi:uncharacterized protein (TIGR00255 family)